MKRLHEVLVLSALLYVLGCSAGSDLAGSDLEGFVLIRSSTYKIGLGARQDGNLVRVEDFEILDHPVTNREYKSFIDATGYPPPLHWKGRKIPRGKANHPVIYVNRWDVAAYLEWLNQQGERFYRLPTSVEFEYAARGGLANQMYPWGNESPEGKANYDPHKKRRFDLWQEYLQPAAWGEKNGYGLYGMAGNVWQMTVDYPEPATRGYMYRIEDLSRLERSVMGGSWARSEAYLECGNRILGEAGMRHPDFGFRPVCEPESSDWGLRKRKLSAVPLGNGNVLLSWALLKDDAPGMRFNVYRANARNHAGFLITEEPVDRTTAFTDSGLTDNKRYQYYVKPVDGSGKEGRRSEWIGVTVSPEAITAEVASFRPLFKQGSLVPVFGDLDGDGALDCVIRLSNGNHEMSQDPGLPVQLEAFTSYGRSLWRKDVCHHDHCYGSANNNPFNVWDMDNDGKAEVITRLQIGDNCYVAILEGMTGRLKHKTAWPEMVSNFSESSTRIHLSIAYLDGEQPTVITQTGLYENEVFVAYDAQLGELWRFNSFGETSGSGSHRIEVADVDGDGRQEIFDGTTCLNTDGTIRWSIYREHPDIVSIHDHLPERPGLEVFYVVESSMHAGVYMVDANSGEVIWKVNREDDQRWTHGHRGWSADIWNGSPGMECVSNRAGHNDYNMILFSADGRALLEPFPDGYIIVEWDGDNTRELLNRRDNRIGNFNGSEIIPAAAGQPDLPENSRVIMAADLYGDFRDELVLLVADENQQRFVMVVTATQSVQQRHVTPTEDLGYRLWLARNMGGGYRSIYDRPLLQQRAE